MEIQDQNIITTLETLWQEAEVLFTNDDLAGYTDKLAAAWEMLPVPRQAYDDSYEIALALAETYSALNEYPAMLHWAEILQDCDPERMDDGEREFVLGKAFFENGDMDKAEKLLVQAMYKSEGQVFEGEDPKYLEVFQGLAAMVEEELSVDIYEQVEILSEEGNALADEDDFDGAIAKFTTALTLLPEPRSAWEASTWLYASIGDMYFFKEDYTMAADHFFNALNGPDAQSIGFVHLRLGESLYELQQSDKALEHLLRAYMLEGTEIFEEEDSRYFDFLKERVQL
ncbi:tetratricopeptide repeat protein [Chitinophaga sp. 30R24]|uniref:tetratricopeptide repeat protein n=1 Tax=Chitinophaga sp. 30R24 TaxID=3248838 RepID=UPI003B914D80